LFLQPVDALAGRPDADGELGGDVRDPGTGVIAQVAQELELRGHDPVPFTQAVVERVVQACLASHKVHEELRDIGRTSIESRCHGTYCTGIHQR
jgi:hypothetical protein